MRVEQALQLLPDTETLGPLRDLVLESAQADGLVALGAAAPYLTVAKRQVVADELRRRLPDLLRQMIAHLTALYGAYIGALAHQDAGHPAEAVAELVRGARLAEAAGRLEPAGRWYAVALGVAEGLQDRRPEVDTQQGMASLNASMGRHADAARQFQRSLVLAEAEFNHPGVIAACSGLGVVAMERGDRAGAAAWLGRGLRQAEAIDAPLLAGRLRRELGVLAHRSGDLAIAGEHLRRARERFEPLGEAVEMARTLDAQGLVEADLGRHAAALAAYREALAWARRSQENGRLESAIRLHLAEFMLDAGRMLEAEEEMRRAEQLAIAAHAREPLVRIYMLMGTLRGREGDETGFIFFEQALALCRAFGRRPSLEAEVYRQYAQFKRGLGQEPDAQAFLERARELFEAAGEEAGLAQVRADLDERSA